MTRLPHSLAMTWQIGQYLLNLHWAWNPGECEQREYRWALSAGGKAHMKGLKSMIHSVSHTPVEGPVIATNYHPPHPDPWMLCESFACGCHPQNHFAPCNKVFWIHFVHLTSWSPIPLSYQLAHWLFCVCSCLSSSLMSGVVGENPPCLAAYWSLQSVDWKMMNHS